MSNTAAEKWTEADHACLMVQLTDARLALGNLRTVLTRGRAHPVSAGTAAGRAMHRAYRALALIAARTMISAIEAGQLMLAQAELSYGQDQLAEVRRCAGTTPMDLAL